MVQVVLLARANNLLITKCTDRKPRVQELRLVSSLDAMQPTDVASQPKSGVIDHQQPFYQPNSYSIDRSINRIFTPGLQALVNLSGNQRQLLNQTESVVHPQTENVVHPQTKSVVHPQQLARQNDSKCGEPLGGVGSKQLSVSILKTYAPNLNLMSKTSWQ